MRRGELFTLDKILPISPFPVKSQGDASRGQRGVARQPSWAASTRTRLGLTPIKSEFGTELTILCAGKVSSEPNSLLCRARASC
jgi:hypothetical protein